MLKLDKKDKKLLYYLSENCRYSNTQLSKKVNLNKNSVQYRIKRLIKNKIITKFACVLNLNALKLNTITLFLRFNIDINENKEIMEYLANHPYINWAVVLSGQWDVFVEVISKDLYHMEELINEIKNKFNNYLNSCESYISLPIKVEHLLHDFFKDINIKKEPIKKITPSPYKLTTKDKNILTLLNKDSSQSLLAMAKKLNMSIDIVRYRIKNLVEKGIIMKFFSEVNVKELGYTEYVYKIKLSNASNEYINKLKIKLEDNINISYAFSDITGFNIIFVCRFKDTEGIDKLSRELRKEFSAIINKQDYFIIRKQIVFNLFPKGLIDI
jgi:Lrp/AsnC family transcriptional regulator, regulator for asnA, asnC and gidA